MGIEHIVVLLSFEESVHYKYRLYIILGMT